MNVLKFGGTSMGDEHTWRRVLDIISSYTRPVVVVSATARTTRQLIAAAEKATEDLNQAQTISQKIKHRHLKLVTNFLDDTEHPQKDAIRAYCTEWIENRIEALDQKLKAINNRRRFTLQSKDAIASIGEQLSAYLIAQCGQAYGLDTRWVDAGEIIKTDNDFGQANPDVQRINKAVHRLRTKTDDGGIPIIGGFYGQNAQGQTTTLGFEGSDYTASLLGAALQSETIEIWTDVSGIYTCDPNMVKTAQPIPELSFQEATELAYFGAKVLHPSTMKPAAAAGIPVFVKNIFEPDHPGTKIYNQQTADGRAKAITYLSDIHILTVTSNGTLKGHAFLAQVFRELHKSHIAVNAVTTTEASVSVALQAGADLGSVEQALQTIGTVSREKEQGLISLIGCSFSTVASIMDLVFSVIPDANPSLVSYSTAKQNLNIALPETDTIPAVCRIHEKLFQKK